jgi:hypothetical protein
MAALPISSYVTSSSVGSYRMFSDPHHYSLALHVLEPDGAREVPLSLLGPHLGLDARRTLLPATQPVFGETAASLLVGGLPDLAELTCRLSPGATRARALLTRIDLTGKVSQTQAEYDCQIVHAR